MGTGIVGESGASLPEDKSMPVWQREIFVFFGQKLISQTNHTQTKSSRGILQYDTREDIVFAGQPVIISSSELTLKSYQMKF